MYSLLIASAVAVLVWVGGALLSIWGWIAGFFLGLLAFAVVWIVLVRRVSKKVQPLMQQVQRQTQAQMLQPAMQSLEAALPYGRWVPLLTGQLHAQLGALAKFAGDEERALRHLQKSSRRSAEGQLMLAGMLYQRGEAARALQILQVSGAVNRKHSLLHNTRAWMLVREGRSGEAINVLSAYLKRDKNNEATKDNLLRLQNDRKLNMQRFGMEWFAVGLERPPASMGEMRQGRKGFRQAPKNPGKRGGKKK